MLTNDNHLRSQLSDDRVKQSSQAGDRDEERTTKKVKRRSRYACISCRSRKIRCDADLRGLPCTNCELDGAHCFTKPRASRRIDRVRDRVTSDESSRANRNSVSDDTPMISRLNGGDDLSQLDQIPSLLEPQVTGTHLSQGLEEDPLEQKPSEGSSSVSIIPETDNSNDQMDNDSPVMTCLDDLTSFDQNQAFPFQLSSLTPYFTQRNNFVTSLCYRFVETDALWAVDFNTASFLEQQGCLHLPTKSLLDHFVQQYFLHIHPLIPILNEFHFWRMYLDDGQTKHDHDRLPLVLFQAILFVSCPYVSIQHLLSLGFINARAARAEFYSRTKTLLDLCPPEDNVVKAQVALLLTYYTRSTTDRTNTYWLSVAIHHAKTAEAPEYETLDTSIQEKRRLKRLWWCCILRDGVMALSLRRQLQIRSNDFDFANEGLTKDDLEEEVHGSIMYDTKTKEVLVELIVLLCELAVILNDVLADLYPKRSSRPGKNEKDPETLKAMSAALDSWYEKAFLSFRIPTSMSDAHPSLILFTNILYTYYNATQACLCKQIMLATITTDEDHMAQESRLHAQSQLNRSLCNISDDMMELKQLELTKYLPNTFIEFCAFSFTWYLLDTSLIPPNMRLFTFSQDRQTYTDLMNEFEALYDGMDGKLQCINKIVEYIEANEGLELPLEDLNPLEESPSAALAAFRDSPTADPFKDAWASILSQTPHKYLRIVLTVEYSLSNGQFPTDGDFPKLLRAD